MATQSPAAERAFPYRTRWPALVACVLFFGVGWLMMERQADANRRGLVLGGLVELSPTQATVFYRWIAWASLGFVGLAAMLAVARVANPQVLRLTADGISVPRNPFAGEPTFVRYAEVRSTREWSRRGTAFWLTVLHAGGKLGISADRLPSRQDYETVRRTIADRGVPVRVPAPPAAPPSTPAQPPPVVPVAAPAAGPRFAYAKLLDAVGPTIRYEKYEEPLLELLEAEGLGTVTGGGTMQRGDGSIEFVGIDLELTDLDQAVPAVARKLAELGAPPGSALLFDVDGQPQSYQIA